MSTKFLSILVLIPFVVFLNCFCFAVGYCNEVLWLLYHLYERHIKTLNWNPIGVFEFISRFYGLSNIVIVYWSLWEHIKPLDIKLYFGLAMLFFGLGTLLNIHSDNSSFFSDSFHGCSCLVALICIVLEIILYKLFNFTL